MSVTAPLMTRSVADAVVSNVVSNSPTGSINPSLCQQSADPVSRRCSTFSFSSNVHV